MNHFVPEKISPAAQNLPRCSPKNRLRRKMNHFVPENFRLRRKIYHCVICMFCTVDKICIGICMRLYDFYLYGIQVFVPFVQ